MSGRLIRERAIVSRRFMPPERSSTFGRPLLGELDELEQLLGALAHLALRDAEVAAVDVEVVEDVQLVVERVLLGTDPEPGPDRRAVLGGVHPEDAQLSPGDRRDRRDHPHRGGLAGAVGAEEAERLAAAYVDVDALDGLEDRQPNDLRRSRAEIMESLVEVGHVDRPYKPPPTDDNPHRPLNFSTGRRRVSRSVDVKPTEREVVTFDDFVQARLPTCSASGAR